MSAAPHLPTPAETLTAMQARREELAAEVLVFKRNGFKLMAKTKERQLRNLDSDLIKARAALEAGGSP